MSKVTPYIDKNGEVRELDSHFFAHAKRGRPRLPDNKRKQQVTMLLDPDIIDHFKKQGRGWQSRINEILRTHLP